MENLSGMLCASPVIAAVKEDAYFDAALASPCKVIFLLTGNICTIEGIVKRARDAGKCIYIHIDLIEGFGKDKYALSYIKQRIIPDGIITTKAPLIKIAKDLNMTVIQRVFMIDNLSFKTGIQSIRQVKPDAVEVMPGIMPSVTEKMCRAVSVPVITGGLVNDKKDIRDSLKAGAIGISTSSLKMWEFRRDEKNLKESSI
jgi:glycerol uptake operon antiterminator